MAKNLGNEVFSVYDGLGYAYDKVFFQKGKPPLSSELNEAQQQLELLTQKSTAHMPSGWLSYRPFFTDKALENYFYTQDPEGSKPEVALVNGWPIYVTNTGTSLPHVNAINLSDFELRSGSRVDGVFLEVWRSLISPGTSDSKPQNLRKVSNLNTVYMYNDQIGWALGDNGVILKTTDGGSNWVSKETPVAVTFNKVKFHDAYLGYAVGNNGYIIKTVNGGESWTVVTTNISNVLNDLSIIDDTTVCVVGDNGTVLLTIDGTNFELIEQTSGVSTDFNGVFFFDTAVGWIVGDTGTLLITNDGGNSWTSQTIIDAASSLQITEDLTSVAFFNLNDGLVVGRNGTILKTTDGGRSWANMTNNIWTGTEYTSLTSLYPTKENTLYSIFIQKEFPLDFSVTVYPNSRSFFSSATYKISPTNYPNSLVLEWVGVQDKRSYIEVLNLDNYANAEELRDAINAVTSPYLASDAALPYASRQKIRVFQSAVDFAPINKPSELRPSSGVIPTRTTTDISFSIQDRAWVCGSNGLLITTENSGAKWRVFSAGTGVDLYDLFFVNEVLGWIVGYEGTIIKYDPNNIEGQFGEQDSDLEVRTKGRIYPEGNIQSEAEDYLEDNMIDPNVGVETTKRVQIQYRIRVVDGIDPFNYPEAGLGAQYVYSMGPNTGISDAGSYTFENMGSSNGDYGLWRSRCRNTHDGFSWAIPMFFVSRRNSSPFNIESNINGSTYFELNAIRPDGLTYTEIVDDDVIDIRRKIVVNTMSGLLEKNIDLLLKNQLKTKIDNKDNRGTQFSTSILSVDTYSGIGDITNLATGVVSSTAVIRADVKTVNSNITPVETELTFGPREKALYINETALYSAFIIRDSAVTSERVQGTWEGLGTNSVVFTLTGNNPTGDDIQYQITATYLDFSGVGLSRVPVQPLGMKYIPDDTNSSLFYRGIDVFNNDEIIEYLDERVSGYKDFTVLYSAKTIQDTVDMENLYKDIGSLPEDDTEFQRSLRKFHGQQFRGSLVEYHYFFKAVEPTSIVRVPKNLSGYGVFSVKSVSSINGSVYKISKDFRTWSSLRDRELTDSGIDATNILIYLDEAFVIPSNTIVEVVMEVTTTSDSFTAIDLGLPLNHKGENQQALRAPYMVNFNVNSKGIEGFYKSVLFPVLLTTDDQREFTIDLRNASSILSFPELLNGLILGISSFSTSEKQYEMYAWYPETSLIPSETEEIVYTTLPILSISPTDDEPDTTGLGTVAAKFRIDPRVTTHRGTIYVPLLVKQIAFENLTQTTTANVLYRYRPYQTLNLLPDNLDVEIMKCSEFLYVSNLGTGATPDIKGEPYESPIENIPVNDPDFLNENMFTNVDDLDFNNFSVDSGFVKLPAIIGRTVGSFLTLSQPNNMGDKLGRAYYAACSEEFRIQAENMSIANPRKVFIPMLARVRSDVTSPFLRGELILLIFSKVYKARTENQVGFFEDEDVEYQSGYLEPAETSVGVYRLQNKPIVRM